MKETKVIIGGDLCPMYRNTELFCNGDARGLFNDLLEEIETADLTVANLECPLIREKSPITKTGPVLGAPVEAINGISRGQIHCLGLANNHILDHGAPGLDSTLQACSAAGIQTFGAGRNLNDASRMLIVNAGSLRIGLMGASEQEWSIATEHSHGANPLDLIDCAKTLSKHRDAVDVSIVLLHDGVESYPLPTPRLMKVCRFLIEQGADMVVCQHSHCAGAFETYGDGHIIYGQGNLIFDFPGQDTVWQEGFLIQLCVSSDRRVQWQPVPYVQSASLPGARRMPARREQTFLQGLAERSEAIKDDGFIEQNWERFCRSRRRHMLSVILGHGRLMGRLNRNGWVVKYLHGKRRVRELLNCVGSDTHREVLLGVLNQCLVED